MNFIKLAVPAVTALLLAACGGGNYSHHEAGSVVVVEGTVDNVVRSDIPHKKKMYSLTAVGFESGQGVTLVGIYPGISRGKNIKIVAEFMENVNGTDLFKASQIAAIKPGAVAQPVAVTKPAAPAAQPAATETSVATGTDSVPADTATR